MPILGSMRTMLILKTMMTMLMIWRLMMRLTRMIKTVRAR
jgi:hypothetical protein